MIPDNTPLGDELIGNDSHTTRNKLSSTQSISKCSIMVITREFSIPRAVVINVMNVDNAQKKASKAILNDVWKQYSTGHEVSHHKMS